MIAPQSKKKQIKAAETRRCGRIGASECLERDRGPGGPPSERRERIRGAN